MPQTLKADQLKNELRALDFDIKAETFAEYLGDEVPLDFVCSDYFKRRFSHDITDITTLEASYGRLAVHLSRRGFYHIFPERMFHRTYSSSSDVPTMVAEYKGRKKEEAKARSFFQPLEAEFFDHRVAAEHEEHGLFRSLAGSEMVDFLIELWNISPNFPKAMVARLLKTMPFMYKIAGDLPLLTHILGIIIQEKVTVAQDFALMHEKAFESTGELFLGVNLATAGSKSTFLPRYHFTIQRIKRPETIEDYLPEGSVAAITKLYLEHTLPFECDFEVDFSLSTSKQAFVMGDAPYMARLGKSSTI